REVVATVRKMVGATKGWLAEPGTIRGDFCCHTQYNVIHASDCDTSAEREINLFFKPEELIDWEDNASIWF
ncbi:MAG: nucleoside-diphosphate kinase, partial [Treponema sp.]|nr:nucleoside-diphosphate kinase [Treponema sp.]